MVQCLMEKVDRGNVLALKELGYGESCLVIESMHKREMAIRTKDLRQADKRLSPKMSDAVGGKLVNFALDSASEWAIMMEPVRNLKIYFVLQRYSPEFEDEVLAFYGKETRNIGIPIDDLYDFTRLCANALVRAARDLCSQ